MQWLVAGLGNPGPRYEKSPHNIGFRIIERLAERHRIAMVAKHKGMFGTGAVGDVDVALLTPLTYMNLSGESVRPAQKSLGLDASKVVVVHDEVDLGFGDVRVKFGGGLAGHNGLRSIRQVLGTEEFVRVRVGVGRPEPGDRRPMADWILAPFDPTRDVEGLVDAGCDAVEQVLEHGVPRAMDRTNRRRR